MSMAEVDKATAATSSPKVFTTLTLGQSYAYAFSSWGEDSYLYTSSDGATSTVTKYAPASDEVSPYLTAPAGVHILGAGVSRCGAE